MGANLPGMKQIVNVAAVTGTVGKSVGLPVVHQDVVLRLEKCLPLTDYDDPLAVLLPGGVGFDINCGVRLLRTKFICEECHVYEQLAQSL